MPPKRATKKHSNGQIKHIKSKSTPSKSTPSKSTPSKSPQAIGQRRDRANGSKIDYIVNARDVMSLKFIRTASDLESMDGFFSPVYVHQLFTNEKIIGYKDLQIRVFFSQPALHCYIEIDYKEKLKNDDTTDIIHEFKKWIKAGFTLHKDEFIQKLDEDFSPIGQLQCQFIRTDHHNQDNINHDDDEEDMDQDEDDDDDDDDDDNESNSYSTPPSKTSSNEDDDLLHDNNNNNNNKKRPKSILGKKAASLAAKTQSRSYRNVRSRNTPRSNRNNHRMRNRNRGRNNNHNNNNKDESEDGNYGDNESEDDESVQSVKLQQLTPRNARLLRRKRRLGQLSDDNHPKKRRRLNASNDSYSDIDDDDDDDDDNDNVDISDAEDQKKDCIQSIESIENKDNDISPSKFNDSEDIIYEIRIGSFGDELMRDFHLRLQFFVLLYIESSSFLDVSDEIWEVMVISKRYRGHYETLGYLTLYKFYAYPDSKRLRISQVIIFPPFQRKGLGFEALQHVYKMAQYRDFIEVNVEDPGEGFQKLRDTTDVYNAFIIKCFSNNHYNLCNLTTYHDAVINGKINNNEEEELSYSPHTKKNKKRCNGYNHNELIKRKPLFPFISQHKKLSFDIYHDGIIRCHKLLKITPEQARIAYECLKYEYMDKDDDDEWKLYKLDIKRRLYAVLNLENIHNYDESGIFARLTQEFNGTIDRYAKILKKRDEWIQEFLDWDECHEYPKWIERKLKKYKKININKSNKNKKKRR